MTLRLHPLLTNLALLGGSLVVALGATELVLRLAPGLLSEEARLRLSWQEQKLSHAARTRPDSAIGFLYVPGGHDQVRQGDVRFSYTTDRDGFRNAESSPDQAQIVAVGDSWTFGFGVDDSVAWPRLLADSLRPMRVRNLGLIGSGPEQYTRILERFGLPLHPAVILYGVFPGNDLDDQEAFESVDAGRPARATSPSGGPTARRGGPRRSGSGAISPSRSRRGWKSRHERFAGVHHPLPDGSPLQLAPARLQPKAERSHRGDPAFDGALAAVARARALATQAGARLVVLVFPTKEEVYLPLRGETAPALTSRWVPALRELGVECLDLTEIFRAHAGGGPLYFEVDGHVNAVGNRVIAQAVQRYLRARQAELGLRHDR